LSKPIQWLNQNHASYINRTYGRDGHLFQGRFKSAVIETDTHLHELTRYIHLNPVRAGMAKHPGDYRWSSYREFLGLRKAPPWLSLDATLKRFGKTRKEQRERYRAFVEEPTEVVQNPLRELAYGAVLGTGEFVDWVRRTCLDRRPNANLAHARKALPRIPVETICAVVATAEEQPPESLLAPHTRNNRPRDLALYLARQHSRLGLADLGQHFGGIGASAAGMACKRLEQELARSRALRDKVTAIDNELRQTPDDQQ